jgi:transcriptional regulator with XRE-family HTH domain
MREHGTRAKYVVEKCRCEPCTNANRTYARQRDRQARRVRYGFDEPNPAFIDATEAREHLLWLSSVGVGKRRVAELTGVSLSAIDKLRQGNRTKCRPETAAKILAVGRSRTSDGAFIDAKKTWRLIDDLLKHGWTKQAIAKAIGSKAQRPALQLQPNKVTARNARAIEQLHETALLRVLQDRRLKAEARSYYRQREREAA